MTAVLDTRPGCSANSAAYRHSGENLRCARGGYGFALVRAIRLDRKLYSTFVHPCAASQPMTAGGPAKMLANARLGIITDNPSLCATPDADRSIVPDAAGICPRYGAIVALRVSFDHAAAESDCITKARTSAVSTSGA